MSRPIATRLAERWNQQVAVDNRGNGSTIIGKIHADVIAPLSNAEPRERLANDGAELLGTSSRGLDAFLREKIAKRGKVIRATGMAVQ